MSDDIVARLRAVLHEDRSVELMNREAACAIERLSGELFPIRKELEEARAALAAARIEVCMVRAPSTNASEDTEHAMREYARSRGWDCFREMEDEP